MLHARSHERGQKLKSFTCKVYSPKNILTINEVSSFVGEDNSGSFGIMAGRYPLVTILKCSTAKLKLNDDSVLYLGISGGVLSFKSNILTIVTSFAIQSENIEDLTEALDVAIAKDEERSQKIQGYIQKLDDEILKRIKQLEGQYP